MLLQLFAVRVCPPQARKIVIIGENSSSASKYSNYYINYHGNSNYNYSGINLQIDIRTEVDITQTIINLI